MITSFAGLPDRYLELLSFRDLETCEDVLRLDCFGVEELSQTLVRVEWACGSQALDAGRIRQRQRAGQPLNAVLRSLLENQGVHLPSPVFADDTALKALTPREATELSRLWQNCIRSGWIDTMLTGDLAFVLS